MVAPFATFIMVPPAGPVKTINATDTPHQPSAEYTEFLREDEDALELAAAYISENVVGQTSFADCLHIALATINKADLLVSWNFKHIVNIERIRGYNSVNIKNGYKQLEIRSPRDLMNYGN